MTDLGAGDRVRGGRRDGDLHRADRHPNPEPTATATATGACIVDPTETAGPYPADGTDTSNGATSNALTVSGVVRSDVHPSFVSSTTVAGG